MSQKNQTRPPRLLLFPQIAEATRGEGKPAIRRYSLTLLAGRAPRRAQAPHGTRPAAAG